MKNLFYNKNLLIGASKITCSLDKCIITIFVEVSQDYVIWLYYSVHINHIITSSFLIKAIFYVLIRWYRCSSRLQNGKQILQPSQSIGSRSGVLQPRRDARNGHGNDAKLSNSSGAVEECSRARKME